MQASAAALAVFQVSAATKNSVSALDRAISAFPDRDTLVMAAARVERRVDPRLDRDDTSSLQGVIEIRSIATPLRPRRGDNQVDSGASPVRHGTPEHLIGRRLRRVIIATGHHAAPGRRLVVPYSARTRSRSHVPWSINSVRFRAFGQQQRTGIAG